MASLRAFNISIGTMIDTHPTMTAGTENNKAYVQSFRHGNDV